MDFSFLLSGGALVAVIAVLIVVLNLGKGKPVSEVITEAQRLANLMIEVASHVKAAEQVLKDKSGTEKLTWVLARLEELFPTLDIEYLRTKVEAAVHDIKGNQFIVEEPGEVTASRSANIL